MSPKSVSANPKARIQSCDNQLSRPSSLDIRACSALSPHLVIQGGYASSTNSAVEHASTLARILHPQVKSRPLRMRLSTVDCTFSNRIQPQVSLSRWLIRPPSAVKFFWHFGQWYSACWSIQSHLVSQVRNTQDNQLPSRFNGRCELKVGHSYGTETLGAGSKPAAL